MKFFKLNLRQPQDLIEKRNARPVYLEDIDKLLAQPIDWIDPRMTRYIVRLYVWIVLNHRWFGNWENDFKIDNCAVR